VARISTPIDLVAALGSGAHDSSHRYPYCRDTLVLGGTEHRISAPDSRGFHVFDNGLTIVLRPAANSCRPFFRGLLASGVAFSSCNSVVAWMELDLLLALLCVVRTADLLVCPRFHPLHSPVRTGRMRIKLRYILPVAQMALTVGLLWWANLWWKAAAASMTCLEPRLPSGSVSPLTLRSR
jgi:hypothetical protein